MASLPQGPLYPHPGLLCLRPGSYVYTEVTYIYAKYPGSLYLRKGLSLSTANRYNNAPRFSAPSINGLYFLLFPFTYSLPHLCCSCSLQAARCYFFNVRLVVNPKPIIRPVERRQASTICYRKTREGRLTSITC